MRRRSRCRRRDRQGVGGEPIEPSAGHYVCHVDDVELDCFTTGLSVRLRCSPLPPSLSLSLFFSCMVFIVKKKKQSMNYHRRSCSVIRIDHIPAPALPPFHCFQSFFVSLFFFLTPSAPVKRLAAAIHLTVTLDQQSFGESGLLLHRRLDLYLQSRLASFALQKFTFTIGIFF